MASPFAVFRRNRKAMLVALTIMAMFAFVIGDQLIRLMDTRQSKKVVVVSTKRYGNLNTFDIDLMVNRRAHLQAIVRGIREAVARAGGRGMAAAQLYQQLGGDDRQTDVRESAVQAWLLANYAREMGMVVSDGAINDYLVELTEDRVRKNVLDDILSRQQMSQGRRGTTETEFYDLLREELLAMRLMQTTTPMAYGTTPGQQWDYFKRMKQQAYIELVALPVRNYADQVKEPNDATLREFFEEHRDRTQTPYSPLPGFKDPAKARVNYLKADVEAFAKQVTDAEILAQYESDRERYDRDTRINLGPPGKAADKQDDIPEPKDTPKSDEKPATDAGDKKPADEPKTETPKPDAPKPDAPKSEEKSADEPKPSDKPAEPKDAPKPDESSALRRGPFKLVADEKPADEEAPKPAEEKKEPADAPKPEAPAGRIMIQEEEEEKLAIDPADKPEEKKPEEKKPEEKKPDEAKPAEPPKPEEKVAEPKPEETMPGEPTRSTPPETGVKTGPTDATKEKIRTELATKKIDALFAQIAGLLSQYNTARITGKTKATPPDLDKFAAENNLKFVDTDLLPIWGLAELELANVFPESGDSFLQTLFGRLYVPTRGRGLDRKFTVETQYIWWTVEEVKERTPQWTDEGVHDRVLDAWKLVEARGLARKAADDLAAEARKAEIPLKEAFGRRPDVTVFDPPPFSWMTTDSAAMRLSLGKVEHVDTPGMDFMRTVFDLGRREVGVAMNLPQTFAYVVRIIDFSPSEKALWDIFTATETNDYFYLQMAQQDSQQMLAAWQRKIEDYAGLKWEQKPQGPSEAE